MSGSLAKSQAACACRKAGGPRSRSRRDRVGHCLSRIDILDDLLPGLGPPRPNQRTLCLAATHTQTVDRDCYRRGRASIDALSGFPTGRPWVSLANRRSARRPCMTNAPTSDSPTPCCLGSAGCRNDLRRCSNRLGCCARPTGHSLPAGPDTPRAATLTRIVECAPFMAAFASGGHATVVHSTHLRAWLVDHGAPCGAVAGRRSSPYPLALPCFARR